MKYLFKKAIGFRTHNAGKTALVRTDFKKGIHEVSESIENDPYFLELVGAGVIAEADKVSSTDKDYSANLVSKIKHQVKAAPEILENAPVEEAAEVEESSDAAEPKKRGRPKKG